MNGLQARSFWRLPALARLGWIFYVASLLMPADAHLGFIGAFMFVVAPRLGFHYLFDGGIRGAIIGTSVLAGVAANASMFMRTPRWLRTCAIFAPWTAYLASLLAFGIPGKQPLTANAFVFPWAIGIGLVNLAYIRRGGSRWCRTDTRTTRDIM